MLINPFSLRKELYDYIGKYAKQARVIVHLKGNLAELHQENDRLLRENHLNFTLNADGTLSKVKFDDAVLGRNDGISNEEAHQRFDADFLLMTSELSQLFGLLEIEFGGVKERL